MDIRHEEVPARSPHRTASGPRICWPACPTGSTRTKPTTSARCSACSRPRPGTSSASKPTSPTSGDYRTTFVGDHAGDRGARRRRRDQLLREPLRPSRRADRLRRRRQRRNDFKCVYHAWSYDLAGNLRGIAFEKGINGRGGMPKDFCKRETISPRKLRTTTLCGLVFAHPVARHAADRGVSRRARCWAASSACSTGRSGCMGRFVQRCPTTGSSTSRTSRTPITRACCTPSSPPSASPG